MDQQFVFDLSTCHQLVNTCVRRVGKLKGHLIFQAGTSSGAHWTIDNIKQTSQIREKSLSRMIPVGRGGLFHIKTVIIFHSVIDFPIDHLIN